MKFNAMMFAFAIAASLTANAQVSPGEQPALSPSADFQTVNRHRSNLIKVDPNVDWSSYAVFVFTPATYEPSNPKRKLSPAQIEKLKSSVDASLKKAFASTAERDGRVLEVKPVITDVRRANLYVNLIAFAAIQAPVSYGAASVRYDLFDSESGALIGEVTSKRSAAPWNMYPWQMLQALQPVAHASTILKRDARMLRKDLERVAQLPVAQGTVPEIAGNN
jgi:hypothetical protein